MMTKEEYRRYLKSSHWQNLKEEKQRKFGKEVRCAICGAIKLVDLHHLFYRKIYDVRLADLRYLCRRCHYLAHTLFIKYKANASHHSKFATLKNKVKSYLGISKKNLFYSGLLPGQIF